MIKNFNSLANTGIKKKALHGYSQYLKWEIFKRVYKTFKKKDTIR